MHATNANAAPGGGSEGRVASSKEASSWWALGGGNPAPASPSVSCASGIPPRDRVTISPRSGRPGGSGRRIGPLLVLAVDGEDLIEAGQGQHACDGM